MNEFVTQLTNLSKLPPSWFENKSAGPFRILKEEMAYAVKIISAIKSVAFLKS